MSSSLSNTYKGKLTIGYQSEIDRAKAENLARELSLDIDNTSACQLLVSDQNLSLKLQGQSPLSLSFITGHPPYKKVARAGIIRACKPRPGLHILDATAGWGEDAMQLARFGAQVTLLERHPVMALLLKQALDEYSQHFDHPPYQLKFYNEDAFDYLKCLPVEDYPDIIYLDPMHPTRKKSALVKKKMQILQQLIFMRERDEDNLINDRLEDIRDLIHLARERTKDSVIVKWPQRLRPLLPPHSSVPGKTIRFDRYTKTTLS